MIELLFALSVLIPQNPDYDYIPYLDGQYVHSSNPLFCISHTSNSRQLYDALKAIHVWIDKLNSLSPNAWNVHTTYEKTGKCELSIEFRSFSEDSEWTGGQTAEHNSTIKLYENYVTPDGLKHIPEYKYVPILEHELGHKFGLWHLNGENPPKSIYESIMIVNETIQPNFTVTNNDINAVMGLYGPKGWGHYIQDHRDFFIIK